MKVYSVAPSDWLAYLKFINRANADKGTMPGRLVSDKIVSLKTADDAWGETSVDVDTMLTKGLGNLVVQWESTIRRSKDEQPDRGTFWLQATHLGVMVQRDPIDLYAWVTDLATGKPLGGAQIELPGTSSSRVKTGSDGLARLAMGDRPAQSIVVRYGADTAFLPATQWQWQNSDWNRQQLGDAERWFIFDDRKLYRPGETAHIKGWARIQTAGKTGDLILPPKMTSVNWTVTDSRGNEVRKGTATVNAWAGFDFSIELPKTMNLGQASVQVNGISHEIDVQEFRRPEFEVTAKNESAGPHIVGDPKGADLSVSAKYYAGGALPATSVTWNVSARQPQPTRRPATRALRSANGSPGGAAAVTPTMTLPFTADSVAAFVAETVRRCRRWPERRVAMARTISTSTSTAFVRRVPTRSVPRP